MSEDNLAPKRLPDEDLITYAGCWVAIADGSVAGVGDTAVAAERLGRQKHVREKLHIVFIEPPEGKPLEKPQLLTHLMELFKQHDQPVYLVGGTVRDMLLGRECKDFDFAVPDRAIKLAYKVADHLKVPAFALIAVTISRRICALEISPSTPWPCRSRLKLTALFLTRVKACLTCMGGLSAGPTLILYLTIPSGL